jgi:transposase InsO family protein
MNAYAERFVRSIKSECLDLTIFLGREPLVRAIVEYAEHYHDERSHQGIGSEIVNGTKAESEGYIEARERLGGLLKYYHRTAA